jgi:hypothetical protein
MKISLVLPTNRSSYAAISRVFEWASLDPQQFELIARDNSGIAKKQALLSSIESPTLRLAIVPPCNAFENGIEALRLATGEFVFFLADDDWLSMRGIQQLHALAEQCKEDSSIACITGDYLVESSSGSGLFRYSGLDSTQPETRIENYLNANASNFLYYSAVRRSIANSCFDFMDRLPYKFSYHDQLISLLYLTFGRVLQVGRIVYGYDLGEWESADKTLAKDRSMYSAAGLPIAFDRLHHLFCALEGALLLDSHLIAGSVAEATTTAADLWFQTMFAKFRGHNRETGYEQSAANEATLKLKNKLLGQPDMDMNELLLDVCETLEVSDPEGAQRYFKFWSTL